MYKTLYGFIEAVIKVVGERRHEHETQRLFQVIRDLKEQGVAIIYISHRMAEIYEICDTVSVFRDGEFIGTSPLKDVTNDDLIAMMVGRKVENQFPLSLEITWAPIVS